MKLFFLFFIILLINLALIESISISPGELGFNIKKGEKMCKKIRLSNEEPINLIGKDVWTDDILRYGKLSEYNKKSSDIDVEISYEEKISNMENKNIEVCIIGQKSGEYFGALVYTTDVKSGVSAGVGTWINLIVDGEKQNNPQKNSNEISKKLVETSQNIESIPSKENIETKKSESIEELSKTEENSVITGAVIGTGNKNWKIIAAVLIIIFVAIIAIYNKNKREVYA